MITLLILFQLKHFLADYPLQGEYMIGKFRERGWFLPLLSHAAVHAAFTFAIVLWATSGWGQGGTWTAVGCAVFDAVVHGTMDRVKASPRMLGRYKPLSAAEYPKAAADPRRNNKLFWWSLGLDQMVHHLTHYAIIYYLTEAVWRHWY